MAEYFATVAGDLEANVVDVPGLDRSGIVWEDGLVLTTRVEPALPRRRDGRHAVRRRGRGHGSDRTRPADCRAAHFAGGRADAAAAAARRGCCRAASGPSPCGGATAGPASRRRITSARRRSAGGQAWTVDEVLTNVAWSREMTGGGLFDLDGNLLAVVTPCGERFTAVAADGVAENPARRAVPGGAVCCGTTGCGSNRSPCPSQEYFALHAGLLVREVWAGYRADEAGLEPGDVLVAFNTFPAADIEQCCWPLVDEVHPRHLPPDGGPPRRSRQHPPAGGGPPRSTTRASPRARQVWSGNRRRRG